MTNMRFHLIAVSSIIALVLLVFAVTGKLSPKAPVQTNVEQEVSPTGPLIITVWEASWGLNCNEQSRFSWRTKPGTASQTPKVEIPKNNVLDKVKALCDGKETCEFTANDTTLGKVADSMRCRPELTLMYRCFDFDRPWNITVRNSSPASIRCKKS